jgi:predicted dehydrogenase
MFLNSEERAVGKENFYAAIASKYVVRQEKATNGKTSNRDFLLKQIRQGLASGKGLGAYYFGYDKVKEPVRVGVIGTGDEGSVLIGAINPEYLQVKAIADIRPYNVYRAFHGELNQPVRPGLMKVYGWKTEEEARKNVKVYGDYLELIKAAKADGIEAIICALPLHLHAPCAIAAMKAGLHVITEKLMAHSVHECKEMARVAKETKLYLAVGHQRHYSIVYDNAVELIRNGVLGDVHYISALWHRNNLPGKDSWKQPLPPGSKPKDEKEIGPDGKEKGNQLQNELTKINDEIAKAKKELDDAKKATKPDPKKIETLTAQITQREAQKRQKEAQISDKEIVAKAKDLGYEAKRYEDAMGKEIYDRPAIEELIRWRLWDRTGAGLMAELGSHQLDASSIFIAAMLGEKKHPISVGAVGNRPVFPQDRDIEDHVYCVFEFPSKGYDPKDEEGKKKKVGVQYSSINGNGFGGYGETVYGTEGTLIIDREQEALLYKVAATTDKMKLSSKKVKVGDKEVEKPVLDAAPDGDEEATALGMMAMTSSDEGGKVSRGYTEELEHWAWCIRNPKPENQPKCGPKVAMADAVIALVSNMAAREGRRIEFRDSWFDPESDETPENVKPDVTRYK